MGDVQDSQGVSASKMTYIVSGGALNSAHTLVLTSWFILPLWFTKFILWEIQRLIN